MAVKALARADSAAIRNLRREAQALQDICHPGVVRIVAWGDQGGLPWYAMEIIEGDTLTRYCSPPFAPACPDEQRARSLTALRRVCDVLAYVHGEGIVHRDLKPQNILVTATGQPVLVDFGLAAKFSPLGGREVLAAHASAGGTISYMSPEQIAGLVADARTDLYAIGCLLFELLTGRPPFVADSPYAVLVSHLREPAPTPSQLVADLDPRLDRLVLGLLRKEPRERIGYADTVASVLTGVGAGDSAYHAAPAPRTYLYRPGVIGRDDVLATIRSAVASLGAGTGGVLFLVGESGIGKTRVALEAVRIAEELDVPVLTGECSEHRRDALEAFKRPLRQLGDQCLELGAPAVERIFGERGRVLSAFQPAIAPLPGIADWPPPAELPGLAAVRRVQQFMTETLRAFASGRALLLVLDDLQWADELSLAVLEHALAEIRAGGLPMLVLATVRREAVNERMQQLLAIPSNQAIPLGRLPMPAVITMVGDMLALDPPPEHFSSHVATWADGNPFFVAEYLRGAVDHGYLWRDEWGRWQMSEALAGVVDGDRCEALPLPRAIRDLILKRFATLSHEARSVLQLASAAGATIDESLLQAVVAAARGGALEGIAEASVNGALRELERRQILEAGADGLLRFAHAKLLETAYLELDAQARAALHGAIAEALLHLRQGENVELGALARHFDLAGKADEARTWYEVAAESPQGRQAPQEAAELLKRAAELWTGESSAAAQRQRASLILRRAALLFRLGQAKRAAELLLESEHAAHLAGSPEDALHAVGMRLGILVGLGDAGAAAEAQRAQGMPGANAVSKAAGYLITNVGLLHLTTGDMATAKAYLLRGLETRRAVGDRDGTGGSLTNLGTLAQCQGESAEGIERFRDAIEIFRATGNRYDLGIAVGNLAHIHTSRADTDQALPMLAESLELARETFHVPAEIVTLINFSVAHSARGDLAAAEQMAREALTCAQRSRTAPMIAESELEVGRIRHLRGDLTAALEHLRAAESQAEPTQNPQLQAGVGAFLARLLYDLGDSGGAAALWRRVVELYAATKTSDRGTVVAAFGLWRCAHAEGASSEELAATLANLRAAAATAPGWDAVARVAVDLTTGRPAEVMLPMAPTAGWDLCESLPLAWTVRGESMLGRDPATALAAARNVLKLGAASGLRVSAPAAYFIMDRAMDLLGAHETRFRLRQRAAHDAAEWLAACPESYRESFARRPEIAYLLRAAGRGGAQ
ncbi:MAG: AAA family ATPase [Candidatus Schekmanbacteria bacterium]|nr:AAA family ATPase [Candidatus Schekmanbacteria bacterium]